MALLQVNNLVKKYGKRTVVDGVSFQVEPGEIVGLLGRNGAGKTTTFRMVMGMIRPDAGEVLLKGKDLSQLPMFRRAQEGLGYLSQEPSIFRKLSVADNIRAILETLGLRGAKLEETTREHLARFGLLRLADSLADTLSGGERRRLEITRSLLTTPALLLLDEPFSGVDPIAVAEIQEIVRGLKQQGLAILLTDHNVRETLAITDRSYIIRDGKVIAGGNPAEILENAEARKHYLGESFRM